MDATVEQEDDAQPEWETPINIVGYNLPIFVSHKMCSGKLKYTLILAIVVPIS